jgi:PKD repeat protein
MKYTVFLGGILIILIAVGCSGNPTIPGPGDINDLTALKTSNLPVGVTEWSEDGSPAGGMGTLGLFNLTIDPQTVSAELTPLRDASLTDVLEVVDITNFLTLAPCVNCAKLNSISQDTEGHLVLNIGIKHPFPAGDPLKPITGRNRGDLHVFNVEGQIISSTGSVSFPGLNKSIADFTLVNADGYSSYLDSVLDNIYPTDATLHPYILHFDDYSEGNFNAANPMGFESVTTPPPAGNLVMAMGCDYDSQDYIFDLDGKVNFIYAVGCTYAVSAATKIERFTPEYRVPQHNKKAASEVRVSILANDLTEGDDTSSATLQIEVLDINHGVAAGTALNEMLSDSSVGTISAEIPGVTSSPVISSSPIPTGGDPRDPLNPLKFEISVTNSALGVEGKYKGLVKVLDTYAPGQNTSPLLNGMDGIKRVGPAENPLSGLFAITEFATYATFSIDVESGTQSQPPVAIISPPCEEEMILIYTTLFFDGRLSYDDGAIVSYAWDFDWDGDPANFDVDASDDHVFHQYVNPNSYTVGLRVEDNEGLFGYDSVNILAAVEFVAPMWHAPELVASWDGVEASERNYDPCRQVVADCDGLAHMVFKFRSNGGPQSGLYYVNFDNAHMSTPEYLDGSSDGLYQPTLRIDTNDTLHLAYYTGGAIRYMKREGGVWSAPEIVITTADTPGYGIEFSSMDINYLGEIMITFPKITSNINWYLAYVFNDGSGWSAHQDITPFYSDPYYTTQMVNADHEGRFHLLYKGYATAAPGSLNLFHVIFENGSWSTPNMFNSDGGSNIALSGFVAPDGDVFAVWQTDRFGTFNCMYQRYDAASETWGPSIRVSQNPLAGDYSFIPDLAVDANGLVMYVWEYYDGTWRHIYYKQFFETDNATTILNYTEHDMVIGTWNRTNPQMFFEQDGKIRLVYEDDRANPGTYWDTDMYYILFQ